LTFVCNSLSPLFWIEDDPGVTLSLVSALGRPETGLFLCASRTCAESALSVVQEHQVDLFVVGLEAAGHGWHGVHHPAQSLAAEGSGRPVHRPSQPRGDPARARIWLPNRGETMGCLHMEGRVCPETSPAQCQNIYVNKDSR